MDCSQDLLEFDSKVNRINIPRESDPFLPVLPSPDIPEEPLEDGLNTPPVTPLQPPTPMHLLRRRDGYFHRHL